MPPPRPIPRQVALPLSKAVEIAYKSIRLRLGRSLLVTSGIVLALAFLMAVLATDAANDAMRAWVFGGPVEASQDRQRLQSLMEARGVPTTPRAVAEARLQTRWLLTLALLVAGVGILNAMLMSVTERFREIGTMKCLGALDGFIVKLFLIESLFQGAVGTVVGVAVGLLLALASLTLSYGRFAWDALPVGRLLACVAACVAIGVVLTVAGAIYPAWQAARMEPIEAMRVEA
ncbi:MAG TPA: FtsX-like permease family protein [Tepidisphaeraceae bacterium]|nr:FtsX-like permease family protein [Tepidisphaeraceae bacterium]